MIHEDAGLTGSLEGKMAPPWALSLTLEASVIVEARGRVDEKVVVVQLLKEDGGGGRGLMRRSKNSGGEKKLMWDAMNEYGNLCSSELSRKSCSLPWFSLIY